MSYLRDYGFIVECIFNCIYRPEVLQLIYIRFNVMMPLSNPTMNNVCNIPLIFICVHNAILCFLSYHVPMFSLLMYFVRNDKNKDDQSINQSINQSICRHMAPLDHNELKYALL